MLAFCCCWYHLKNNHRWVKLHTVLFCFYVLFHFQHYNEITCIIKLIFWNYHVIQQFPSYVNTQENWKHVHTKLYMSVYSSKIHNSFLKSKQHIFPSTDEQIYWLIIFMQQNIKRNEALIFSAIWINFENTMFNERNPTQKVTYYMILLYEIYRIGNFIETESRLVTIRE